ncbi:Uncharacterised protein [Mycobacteroides abscessus subsp. abscessus]|nr:Uncharacterised protein [Mycobacteroides abscessus subsp. abscessus]SKP85525.1 Uncharacterised protein [Mycobacteroides abscessus subsp. abscessus]
MAISGPEGGIHTALTGDDLKTALGEQPLGLQGTANLLKRQFGFGMDVM